MCWWNLEWKIKFADYRTCELFIYRLSNYLNSHFMIPFRQEKSTNFEVPFRSNPTTFDCSIRENPLISNVFMIWNEVFSPILLPSSFYGIIHKRLIPASLQSVPHETRPNRNTVNCQREMSWRFGCFWRKGTKRTLRRQWTRRPNSLLLRQVLCEHH